MKCFGLVYLESKGYRLQLDLVISAPEIRRDRSTSFNINLRVLLLINDDVCLESEAFSLKPCILSYLFNTDTPLYSLYQNSIQEEIKYRQSRKFMLLFNPNTLVF